MAGAVVVEEQVRADVKTRRVQRSLDPWLIAAVAAVAILAVVACFRLESTARGMVDAQTLKAWSVRTHELGVSSYTGTGNQRGPLWVAFYLAGLHLSNGTGFWFAMAALLIVTAAVTAAAAAMAVRDFTGTSSAAAAIGTATFAYLTLGPEEFSLALLSRNISAMFTVVSFAALWFGLRGPSGRRRCRPLLFSGAALGLAIQTMPTTALPAAVFGVSLLAWCGLLERSRRDVVVAVVQWGAAVIAGFATAPIYYAIRGDFSNFWNLYWGYNKIYASATPASVSTKVHVAVDTLSRYYAEHAVFVAVVLAYVALVVAQWRRQDPGWRLFTMTLAGWWIAEIGSVIAGQRYFGHHYILPLIPTVIMGGVVLDTALRDAEESLHRAVALLAIAAVCLGAGSGGFRFGWHRAAVFRGLDRNAEWHFLALPSDRRAQRALVEAITTRRDHLQAWSHWTGFYDELDRPPATRYNALTWFIGFVYGRPEPDPRFILPGTFERWHEDMRRTPPRLFLVAVGVFKVTVPEPSGEVKKFLDDGYTALFSGFEGTMYVDNGLAHSLQALLARRDGGQPLVVPLAPRASDSGALGLVGRGEPARAGYSLKPPGSCYALDATLDPSADPQAELNVSFQGSSADPEVRVAVGRDRVRSLRSADGGDAVEADAQVSEPTAEGRRIQVLTVRRSALVFVDGRLAGMMRTTARHPSLALSARHGSLRVRDMAVRRLEPSDWAPCGR